MSTVFVSNELTLITEEERQLLSTQYTFGNEALFIPILKILPGIVHRICSNLKTMLRMFADFKRAELTYYTESHWTRVQRTYALSFTQVKDLQVPIPRGMNARYIVAIPAIANCLVAINARPRTQAALAYVKNLLSVTQSGDPKLVAQFMATNRLESTDVVERMFQLENQVFTDKSTGTVKFSQAYSDMGELKQVVAQLLDMEKHLYTVSDIFKSMQLLEDTVDKLVAAVEVNINSLNSKIITEMATTVRTLAVTFEKYGLVINDLNRLIHNQVEVLEVIRKAVQL